MPPLVSPIAATLRGAGIVISIALAGLVGWFLALYPLVPHTRQGWLAAVASGLAVTVWAAVCSVILVWFERRPHHKLLHRMLGFIVAVSLGLGVFGAAFKAREFISANSSYFGR